jgi:lipoprotein signal peptidase
MHMSTLARRLDKEQHFGTFITKLGTSLAHPTLLQALTCIVLLVLLDQLTKACALWWAPGVRQALNDSVVNVAVGWHIHQPDPNSLYLAIVAGLLVLSSWLLPVPAIAKILFTAAALSNHVEMLARPGTVDFLAMEFGNKIWVANVADLYVIAGAGSVFAAMYHLIKITPSWFAPVRL